MSTPGLSLVGFFSDAEQAIGYLRCDCVPAPGRESEAALAQEWQDARTKIGPRIPNAGISEPQPVPGAFQPYLDALMEQAWMAACLRDLEGASFRFIEIDPLLCHQISIDTSRVGQFWEGLGDPTPATLLRICLPMEHPAITYDASPVSPHSSSVIIKSPRSDLRIDRFGVFAAGPDVILLGARLRLVKPFVHVARVDGRCYLLNGYHRVFGAKRAGATHVPCVFRDAPDHEATGLASAALRDGQIRFPVSLLTSDNPPMMAHFTRGRAHEVVLRAKSRMIHVSWHQYLMHDE